MIKTLTIYDKKARHVQMRAWIRGPFTRA